MIKTSGIIIENEYLRRSRALDEAQPSGIGKTAAVVLAIDIAKRPIKRVMDADAVETASASDVRAFFKRFGKIDSEDPGPLPLQVFDGEPAVVRTVRNVLAAGAGNVAVLARDEVATEIAKALAEAGGKLGAVPVVRYDGARARTADERADGIGIEMVSLGQITQAAQAAGLGESGSDADSLLLIHSDQVDFESGQLRKLRATLEEDPAADFATAYAEWTHGLPLLIAKHTIDRLMERPAHAPRRARGALARPCITFTGRTALMGERKLFGPVPLPAAADEEGALPEHAAAAVASARRGATRYERQWARANAKEADPHVRKAAEFLAGLDAAVPADEAVELEWADAWAQRNRLDFPLFDTRDNQWLVYLDAAATSLTPARVIAAEQDYQVHYDANVWRGLYGNSAYATARYQAAREKVARFIGADPRDCIFTANTSASINLIADAWARFNVGAGDTLCVMANEHHSNLLPWARVAHETGARVEYVGVDESGRLDWRQYEAVLEKRPKLVAAAHVSNVLGLENPIRKMAKAAHEAGAVFALDAAQSIPHQAIDVGKLGVDFVSFSGHKLHGPTGVGVLWAHPDRIREMRPAGVGGGVISEVSLQGVYWRQAPYCFELGTPPIGQAIALGSAVDYLQGLGMDNVERHMRAMTRYALRAASRIDGLRIWGAHGARDGEMGLLSYMLDNLSDIQVALLLSRMGVAARAGAHCAVQLALVLGTPGTVRISFGPYTTKADIEAWGYAMKVIANLAQDEVPRL